MHSPISSPQSLFFNIDEKQKSELSAYVSVTTNTPETRQKTQTFLVLVVHT